VIETLLAPRRNSEVIANFLVPDLSYIPDGVCYNEVYDPFASEIFTNYTLIRVYGEKNVRIMKENSIDLKEEYKKEYGMDKRKR
jgi:hypothetical protein